MVKWKFCDIVVIVGLVFIGMFGKLVKVKYL